MEERKYFGCSDLSGNDSKPLALPVLKKIERILQHLWVLVVHFFVFLFPLGSNVFYAQESCLVLCELFLKSLLRVLRRVNCRLAFDLLKFSSQLCLVDFKA